MSYNFRRIDRFDDGSFHFEGAWVIAQNSENTLLLSDRGSTIALSTPLSDLLCEGKVSDGLSIKLIQHGFAKADGLPEIEFCRKPVPAYFIIDLTNSCNFDCIYCFRDGECSDKSTNHRLGDILEYIRSYCTRHGLDRIGIQAWGGEPLLEADKIIEIAEFFAGGDISVAIEVETNGALVDDALAAKLRQHGISLGVSIDGPRHIHERQRHARSGKSSYDLTMRGIEAIKRHYGSSFGSISVVTKHNVDYPEEMLGHLVSLGIRYAKFNIVRDNRYAREGGLLPETGQTEQFYARLFDLVCGCWRVGTEIFESTIQTRLENLVLSKRRNCCESCGCTGGRSIFSFDRYGGIFPCEMTDFAEERLGSIDDGDLIALTEQKSHSIFFRERRADICSDCPWWFFCRGGCTSRVHYCGSDDIDTVACAVNRTLYPLIAQMITDEPELAAKMLRHK